MDRFIAISFIDAVYSHFNLKSNMDRFIDDLSKILANHDQRFKIQYGQIYSPIYLIGF